MHAAFISQFHQVRMTYMRCANIPCMCLGLFSPIQRLVADGCMNTILDTLVGQSTCQHYGRKLDVPEASRLHSWSVHEAGGGCSQPTSWDGANCLVEAPDKFTNRAHADYTERDFTFCRHARHHRFHARSSRSTITKAWLWIYRDTRP